MTKAELERMMNLVDEQYLNEALEQPIEMKPRRGFFFLGTAAAAVICIGVVGAAHMAGESHETLSAPATTVAVEDEWTADETQLSDEKTLLKEEKILLQNTLIQSEVDRTSYLDKVTGKPLSENLWNISAPYMKYFCMEKNEAYPVLPKADAMTYMPNEYTCKLFDFGNGEDASGLKIYTKSGTPVYATVLLTLGTSYDGFTQSAPVTITADGSCQLEYSIENCQPQELCGVDIYGFENDNELHAFFRINGQGFSVNFGNVGYYEAAHFLEALINSGISIDSIDIPEETFTIEIP